MTKTCRTPTYDFTGSVVDEGRYTIHELLGRGGYGVVYRATENVVSSPLSNECPEYAIKILQKTDLSTERANHLRDELVTHFAVSSHPNVVTLHRTFEDNQYLYMVLDYCRGKDLLYQIFHQGIFWRNDALIKTVIIQLLDALYECHRRHVYHRDLKPENILCNEDGTKVYLSDFGLATNDKICTGFGCGSANYTSPEVLGHDFRSEDNTYASKPNDVWSLGVILVNMLTGRSPWQYATSRDEHFHRYIVDDNYFQKTLPISTSAQQLFLKIFDIDPQTRITIPELRKAILEMDTFFMTEGEVLISNRIVQKVASYYEQYPPKRWVEVEMPKIESNFEYLKSESGDGEDIPTVHLVNSTSSLFFTPVTQYAEIPISPQAASPNSPREEPITASAFEVSTSIVVYYDGEGATEEESVGPQTPTIMVNESGGLIPTFISNGRRPDSYEDVVLVPRSKERLVLHVCNPDIVEPGVSPWYSAVA
ncbi:kinase-like domain-containing protein [Abortiporus biennis]|nr:kinase-like domain-containing protein [Abortiporus biennis]